MNNSCLKNKITIWLLVAVFIFTSVFNASISYAQTEDTQAPMITEVYLTVDGVKCDNYGFTVRADQEVKLCVAANDGNGIGIAAVEAQFGAINEYVDSNSYENEGGNAYYELEYDEENGVYSTTVDRELEYSKWYVDIIRVCDTFGNEAIYSEFDGIKLNDMHFFDETYLLHSYVVTFNTYIDYLQTKVTSTKNTSLEEWNIEIPQIDVERADFLGWRIDDSDILIKDAKQRFEIPGGDFTLTPLYTKNVIRIIAHYQNQKGQDETKSFLLGIEDDATFGQVKELIIKGGYLNNISHDFSMAFVDWYTSFDGAPNEKVGNDFDVIDIFAAYQEHDKPIIGEGWASAPQMVHIKYYWQSMAYMQQVEMGTAAKVTLPYSFNRSKNVMIEWTDVDGSWRETPVEWVNDKMGTAALDSVNGKDYVIQVYVDEPTANTDCSIRVNVGSKRYLVDTAAAKTEKGATVTVNDLNNLSLQVFLKGFAFADADMEFVDASYYSYYKRDLTDVKNGEVNTVFTLTAENGDKQTYRIRICIEKDDTVVPGTPPAVHEHSWGGWKVSKAPTCTETGLQYRECTCGERMTEAIKVNDHKWEKAYTVDKTATTGRAGSKSIHCADCDTVKSGSALKIVRIKGVTANTLVYNGKKRTQNLTAVNFNGKKLIKDKDFTVTYKNAKGTKVVTPKAVGTYRAVVKFKGDYSGTVTKTFKINPQGTKLTKLTKGKKQFTAKWNRKTVQVTGYQIRYSTKQNMKNAKSVWLNKAKTNTRTIKKLKAKQKYWVQIRTYKTVNGVKHFSAWSGKMSIVTR